MCLNSRLILVSIFLSIVVDGAVTQSINSPSLRNGQVVDSMRRFPHHVTIETDQDNQFCGGSILSDQWILTSGLCIYGSNRLVLHFGKLYYHSFNGSFTIAVNKDEIFMHPTYYYDIALIHLPVQLVFSDVLKPISVSPGPVDRLEGRLAVMPGFKIQRKPATTTTTTTTSGPEGNIYWSTTTTDDYSTTFIQSNSDLVEAKSFNSFDHPQQLIYGMFRILSNRRCKDSDSEFDEFLQICTENWVSSSNSVPCWDHGNGLLVGWPAKSTLVGIYSALLNNCSRSGPAVYTNIAEYLPWIESVINIPP